jgi:protein ImuA
MSPGGSSERIAFLRETIARLERAGGPGRPEAVFARVPLGDSGGANRLDRALGGGAARGALHEVVPVAAADAPAAAAFALAMASRFASAGPGSIVWVIEDFAAREWGAPYGPGLALHGLDPARLVLVRAADTRDALWALEEALKCRSCVAVVGELWGSAKLYDLATTKRLADAARAGGGAAILVHPALPASSTSLSSGARGRFAVAGRVSTPPRSIADLRDDPRRRPLPGAQAWSIRLLKVQAEGGRALPFDPERRHDVIWKAEEGVFGDALSVHLAAGSADARPVGARHA